MTGKIVEFRGDRQLEAVEMLEDAIEAIKSGTVGPHLVLVAYDSNASKVFVDFSSTPSGVGRVGAIAVAQSMAVERLEDS